MKKLDRREFIKYMTALGFTGVSVGWLGESLYAYREKAQVANHASLYTEPPGDEQTARSFCSLCAAGCGMKIRLVDGIPVSVSGLRAHPLSRGGLCPRGFTSLQLLYHPDRIQGPLIRQGKGKGAKWSSISWEEATKTITSRLSSLVKHGESHRMAVLDGAPMGLTSLLWKHFCHSLGSPNCLRLEPVGDQDIFTRELFGWSGGAALDLENSDVLLNFSGDLFNTEVPPLWFTQVIAGNRQQAGKQRKELITIDQRYSMTAAKSDQWIAVHPGTAAALAMGLAYMIIQEDLYDHTFVSNHCLGFEDWTDTAGKTRRGIKRVVLEQYSPERVSLITGVPLERITSLARRLATAQSPIAFCSPQILQMENGVSTGLAIHLLNTLLGSIGRRGGLVPAPQLLHQLWQKVTQQWQVSEPKEIERIDGGASWVSSKDSGLRLSFIDNVLQGKPYSLDTLFVHNAERLTSYIDSEKMGQCFSAIPFIVTFSNIWDDSCEFADIILPESAMFEKYRDNFGAPFVPYDYFNVSSPVIEPLADTKPVADVIIGLCASLSSTTSRVPKPLFQSYQELLEAYGTQLYKTNKGMPYSEQFTEQWLQFLNRRGWRLPPQKPFDQWWAECVAAGGWIDPVVSIPESESLFKRTGKKVSLFLRTKKQNEAEQIMLPEYHELRPSGDEFEYPLMLLTYELNLSGKAMASPLMLEMSGFRRYSRWGLWIDINPKTAAQYQIEDDDLVEVASAEGSLRLRARINPTVPAEVCAIPRGFYHKRGDRYSRHVGSNTLTLFPLKYDGLTGIPFLQGVRVTLRKV